jgi:DNA-binding IscR family transcriptional regulator
VTACSDVDHSCDQYAKCNIRDPLWRLKDRIAAALGSTSVAELVADMTPMMPPPGTAPVAFVRKTPGSND